MCDVTRDFSPFELPERQTVILRDLCPVPQVLEFREDHFKGLYDYVSTKVVRPIFEWIKLPYRSKLCQTTLQIHFYANLE